MKKKFLIGGVIIVLAIIALSFTAFKGAATYYYAVGDVMARQNEMIDRTIRVAGNVGQGSVVRDNLGSNNIRFDITDPNNTSIRLSVVYKGAIPDTFKEGIDAVVEGRLSSSGIFEAQQIIVKCPSKYEPKS